MNTDLMITATDLQQPADITTLLERFISYIDVKEVTVKSYGVCLRCFMDWMQDNAIQEPRRSDIQDYVQYLAAPHPRRQR